MRTKSLFALLALAAVATGLLVVPSAGSAPHDSTSTYIVQLAQSPAVAYTGGVPGLKATKPAKGQKIDPLDPNVVKYADYLRGKHDALLASVGGANKLYSYVYSYDGFAAKLTEKQAARLVGSKEVFAVTPDEKASLDTSSTPEFLGLSAPGGLWDQLGGPQGGKKGPGAGEGVIIGMIDSGIWPEHPSVSDRDANGKLVFQQIPGWHGRCVPGEQFNASNCNQKLIGAQFYNAGFGGNAGIDDELPYEINSARDVDGHGTHTSTTAGGNYGVAPTGPATVFGNVSGMAPRARIATYKTCWGIPPEGGCFNSDSVAAIDQAVADGVDVINYSISGTRTNFRDPVEIAFLFAADAGVFVAASAGNSGPTTSTVAHPGPWLTTVAAGTHNRNGEGSVTLGNGATYSGASLATPVSAPLIDSEVAGLAGADPTAVRLCFAAVDNGGVAVLDPAKVAGKIVVCDRGVTNRVNKSLAVQQAGGVGMILLNTSANSLNADFHFVPTVHLQNTDRAAVKLYAAGVSPTATINQASIVLNAPAPFTAVFSSRGPLQAGGGDLLKPDLIAPGQDILAGVSPLNGGRLFDLISGTSMSSPHVAGLAALLKDLHPDWSPMMIKSALMTTGYDVLDGPNTNPLVIFRQGAGHVRPNSAADPGLVFDSRFNDWLAFICATQPEGLASLCSSLPATDASDLNMASIAIGDIAAAQTVTRTVKSVGSAPETYTPSYTGLSGFTVGLPAAFAINPGASAPFNVTFTRTTAPLNIYTGGQITLTGNLGHVVRIPVVIKPVALAAPAEVSGTGGAINYNVKFGYTGAFAAAARGLVPATVTADTVADDPANGSCSTTASPYMKVYPVAIPAGMSIIRYQLFNADVAPGSDIDLCVFEGASLVAQSAGGTSDEVITFNAGNGPPFPALNLTVVVHGWGVLGSSPFKLHEWRLGTADAGNMTVTAPASATQGATGNIGLTFSGLAGTTKYLGSVAYSGSPVMPNPTIVRVDTP